MNSGDTGSTMTISRVYLAKIYSESSSVNMIKRVISLQAGTQQIPASVLKNATQALPTLLRVSACTRGALEM